MSNKWVSAVTEPMAGLNTLGTCLGLADLVGDGDQKLVLADLGTGRYNMRLKVFKGVVLVAESALVDAPSALVPFFMESTQPSVPAIAIASGASIFVYKNLKPYYKFLVPSLEVNEVENEAWKRATTAQIDAQALHSILTQLREEIGMRYLTARSQRFLLLDGGDAERGTFVDRYRSETLKRQDVITAMTTMKKSSSEETAIDCIVCGTEMGHVYVIDAQAFTVHLLDLDHDSTNSGIYDVDYRIIAGCRDAGIYIFKRNMTQLAKPTIQLKSHLVGLVKVKKQLAVACLDQSLHYFSMKGRHLNQVRMEARICSIEAFNYRPREYTGTLVALENNEIRLYEELFMVDKQKIDQPANWLKFGKFGREEGALIIGTKMKLFRRTAKLEERSHETGPPAAQSQKLAVPKKTKIFVDQTVREREQAKRMHQVFQRDLFMLRLHTAEAYAQLLGGGDTAVATKTNQEVNISVEVFGFGPCFELIITVQSAMQLLQDLLLSFQYSPVQYSVKPAVIEVPILVPAMPYMYTAKMHCLNPEKGLAGQMKVVLSGSNSPTPLLIAVVSMPISELPLLD